ncbi:MAG: UDP-N-acetylglucosamine pyrophosphorylase [Clostridia bacterium]|nr:UDP-N-acetylglucosamine pyrophosphorylase [Clostridia bacterium]
MLETNTLLSLEHTMAKDYLSGFEFPWQALAGIKDEILRLIETLDKEEYTELSPGVWAHKSATVFPSAYIGAPCIIGRDTQVRQCAFIRGSALIGEGCVIGNSVEVKNAIIFDGAQVPHFNYVGDSILGFKSHMGAGAVTSNVKQDKTPIVIKNQFKNIETGLKKFGAILGDHVEIGCNSVLNPGTVIGRNSRIYPLSSVRGCIGENIIYKGNGKVVKMR